jgi:hypothetical protein
MKFIRILVEKPTIRNGRPHYRWTNGYVQIVDNGVQVHPAVSYAEARKMAEGQKLEIIEFSRTK